MSNALKRIWYYCERCNQFRKLSQHRLVFGCGFEASSTISIIQYPLKKGSIKAIPATNSNLFVA